MLIHKCESVDLCHYDTKVFIGYSNDIDDIYENIDEYNKKSKILIVLDNMITGMLSNEKLQSISLNHLSEVSS